MHMRSRDLTLRVMSALWLLSLSTAVRSGDVRPSDHGFCPSPQAATQQIREALAEMLGAIRANDLQRLNTRVTADYYFSTRGRRYSAAELVGEIRALRDQGLTFQWSVTDLKIQLRCSDAAVAYVNEGSRDTPDQKTPTRWAEFSRMRFDGLSWRAEFTYSSEILENSAIAPSSNVQ
jgi:hypothetical protein